VKAILEMSFSSFTENCLVLVQCVLPWYGRRVLVHFQNSQQWSYSATRRNLCRRIGPTCMP